MEFKYGRYTVLREIGKRNGMRLVSARCDCGVERDVYLKNLKSGNSTSCGCASAEKTSARNFKHGLAKTPTWKIWVGMLQRCSESSGASKVWYFDRGIKVCERWKTYTNFLADMGERPIGMSIDRFPNINGNYEPGNCRWASDKEQARNRSTNTFLNFNGERKTCAEWAQELGLKPHVITNRLRYGWSTDRILTTPTRVCI